MNFETGLSGGSSRARLSLGMRSAELSILPPLREAPGPNALRRDSCPALRLESRLTLRHLKTIDAIDRYGSLSQAGIALGKTQPALSKALAEAEDVLGIELFERRARGVVRSARAEMVVLAARSVLAALRRLEDELDCEAAGKDGIVAVGAVPAAASELLPGVARAFTGRPARSQLRLSEGSVEALLAKVSSGEIDIFLGPVDTPDNRDDVVVEQLFREPFGIVARSGHPLFERPAAHALHEFDALMPSDVTVAGGIDERQIAEIGLRTARGGCSNSMGYIREILHASDHVAVVPMLTVASDLGRGSLRLARICEGAGRVGGVLVRRGSSRLNEVLPVLRCIRTEVSHLIARGVLAPASSPQLEVLDHGGGDTP